MISNGKIAMPGLIKESVLRSVANIKKQKLRAARAILKTFKTLLPQINHLISYI